MDFAHLHLMLNHVPVLGVIFALLMGLGGVVFRSNPVIRLALGILVFSAIVAVPVYLTGEPAEEIVEKLPGVTGAITEQHESAAMLSLILAGISGLFALLTMIFGRVSKVPGFLVTATMLVTLLTTTSMIRTANLGGQIRHTEIRSGTQNIDTVSPEKQRSKKDGDDD